MEPHWQSERAQLPRNMIENTMFEEEPDAVDLAKDSRLHPLEHDKIEYEPHSSRLMVRGLDEHDLDDDEEDYESSVRLLGKSFMNRSSNFRNNVSGMYNRDSCSLPIRRTLLVGAFVIVIILSISMVVYFLPKCTFTKEGCHKLNMTSALIYPLATNGQVFPWPKMRLPKAVVPMHYDLTLHPNLTTLNFTGSVHISLRIMEDTNNITLHSSGLKITVATITPEGTSHPKNVQVLEYPPHKQIAIKVNPMLTKEGKYVLYLKYSANLSDNLSGFFKGTYQDQNKRRILAATQFKPFFARSAFPCFDEPAFNATYVIRIIREADHISLSSMPKDSTSTVADGLYQDTFMKSFKMSTYLVAFVVADLTNVSCNARDGTLVSVYAVPGKRDQMKYPLEVAKKLLNFFESFFNISYSLKKLDLVALPVFQKDAAESWGLINFQEMALLCKEETASVRDKQMIVRGIAHELAHQWFGNLVTLEWWNDLWLKEGFATLMEEISVKKVFPELQGIDEFQYFHFVTLREDSMNSSHPLSNPVETFEQIEEMFDFISFQKGASVLMMLKNLLNETIFQQGIRQYLKEHMYQKTKIEDFWNSISKVGNVDLNVKEIMETWTRQTGYPVVTVKLDTTASQIHLNQTRFLRTSHSLNSSSSSYYSHLWHIPLTYITSSCTDYEQPKCIKKWLLKNKTDTIDLKDPNVTWVKFNINSSGYYIVEYDKSNTEKLMGLLQTNHEALSDHDRADLIYNAFLLASVGNTSIKKVLNMTSYFKQEASAMPLFEFLRLFYNIYKLVQIRGDFTISNRIKDYIFDIFGQLIDQQTWSSNGSISERQLRSQLLTVACDLNYDTCVQNASDLFDKWMNSSDFSVLPSDLAETIVTVGARTVKGWTFMRQMYNHLQSVADQRKILKAMAKTNNADHLLWLMYNSLNDDAIKIQELPCILDISCISLSGCLLAWDFVKKNWEELIKKFDLGLSDFQIIVIGTASKFSTKTHLLEVRTFFDSVTDKSSQPQFIRMALDIIQVNIQWMERNFKILENL
ncbi:leucyl-cystinyl aminopeptidase-like isoform X2 [Hypanus sabinus]|uniref:leucyl-cystinyl aminopeptidase-like isoform X2 n=1 Tax=Hypanus sabinus TaxID=79690 RepID=UPI0028C3F4F1|nr:leucyl-cystinyl aminopeptidase-like isoform X2 [Hypanus sabinus]